MNCKHCFAEINGTTNPGCESHGTWQCHLKGACLARVVAQRDAFAGYILLGGHQSGPFRELVKLLNNGKDPNENRRTDASQG